MKIKKCKPGDHVTLKVPVRDGYGSLVNQVEVLRQVRITSKAGTHHETHVLPATGDGCITIPASAKVGPEVFRVAA